MKKKFLSKKNVLNFKNDFISGDLDTLILTNFLYRIKKKSVGKKYHKFLDYIKTSGFTFHIPIIKNALTANFGKYDFIIKGNSKYHNWVLEHKSVTVITSEKMELAYHSLSDKLSKETLEDVLDFLMELNKICLIYYQSQSGATKPDLSAYIEWFKEDGWLFRNKWTY